MMFFKSPIQQNNPTITETNSNRIAVILLITLHLTRLMWRMIRGTLN